VLLLERQAVAVIAFSAVVGDFMSAMFGHVILPGMRLKSLGGAAADQQESCGK
jgi:hypothetical protein